MSDASKHQYMRESEGSPQRTDQDTAGDNYSIAKENVQVAKTIVMNPGSSIALDNIRDTKSSFFTN